MAVASFAMTAASAAASHSAESDAADQQNRLYAQNRANAQAAFTDNQVALSTRQSQEMEAAAAQTFDSQLEARKAKATNVVAAGESGVNGISIESLIAGIDGKEARYEDRIGQQTDWTLNQLQAEKKSSGYQMVDRINSVRQADKPSFVSTGLKIAGGAVDSFSKYKSWSKG